MADLSESGTLNIVLPEKHVALPVALAGNKRALNSLNPTVQIINAATSKDSPLSDIQSVHIDPSEAYALPQSPSSMEERDLVNQYTDNTVPTVHIVCSDNSQTISIVSGDNFVDTSHRHQDTLTPHSIKIAAHSQKSSLNSTSSISVHDDIGEAETMGGGTVCITEADDDPSLEEMAITEVCSDGIAYDATEIQIPISDHSEHASSEYM